MFRGTFLCFLPDIAEGARIFGNLIDESMNEASFFGPDPYCRDELRATALDLYHLDRFMASARLGSAAARGRLRSIARLISRALREDLRPPRQTPAFREDFLRRLPAAVEQPLRSLGAHLYATLAAPLAEQRPLEARQGAADELGFLASDLAGVGSVPDDEFVDKEEERIIRFAGRIAKLLEVLSRRVARATAKTSQGGA